MRDSQGAAEVRLLAEGHRAAGWRVSQKKTYFDYLHFTVTGAEVDGFVGLAGALRGRRVALMNLTLDLLRLGVSTPRFLIPQCHRGPLHVLLHVPPARLERLFGRL